MGRAGFVGLLGFEVPTRVAILHESVRDSRHKVLDDF
jgi:hypothetical protein